MLNFIKTFRADEDGAVTVDWVVLTAAIVGLGIAVLGSVRSCATDLAGDINTDLTAIDPTLPMTGMIVIACLSAARADRPPQIETGVA